ncbi:MAG: DNA polymerase bacteriophage-type [Comamonadaceae bacterium]|nr:MAG: DNA polymerase bacteriophage-type [Comamonadaceae bacterium]
MSLNLDPRQRAMLHEMGVHVWWPEALLPDLAETHVAIDSEAARADVVSARGQNDIEIPSAASVAPPMPVASPVVVSQSPQPKTIAPSSAPSPTQVTALPDGIAGMDWPQLQATVADCQACAMCLGRRASVLAAPDVITQCDWLVVGDPPDEAQERQGLPFVEDAGLLLDNMLQAVEVQRYPPSTESSGRAYLTHVLKCRPALMRAPSADELATCAHYLRREIALTQPKVILAMGRFAIRSGSLPVCRWW